MVWLVAFVFVDSFDSSYSRLELVRDTPDVRELGLSYSSFSLDVEVLLRFLSAERSVSGGVGGRSSLGAGVLLLSGLSVDVDLLMVEPRSVASGVIGSLFRRADPLPERSSRLWPRILSLLWALLKLGYGKLTLLPLSPGIDVLENSGTSSVMDEDLGSGSRSRSRSFSLSFSLSLSFSFSSRVR